jgi:hypothetical protein
LAASSEKAENLAETKLETIEIVGRGLQSLATVRRADQKPSKIEVFGVGQPSPFLGTMRLSKPEIQIHSDPLMPTSSFTACSARRIGSRLR